MPSPTTHNPANQGGDDSGSQAAVSKAADVLLKRIRTRFKYMTDRWAKIRASGANDMQALGPDGPWDPIERAARLKANRPIVHLDQLNQYPNTLVNQFRQNPIGVKVKPAGNGANDKTSTLRGDRIRAIEFESNAPQAYETALRCSAERGYGVITLETEEIAWDGWDQRIKIVREPDPDAVIWDPDCKEADSSDMEDGFKVWQMPIDEFKRKYPGARVTDCNLDNQQIAPGWINVERQTVQVAKYSYFEYTKRYVYLLEDGSPKGFKVFKDELPDGVKADKGQITFADTSGRLQVVANRSLRILKEKPATQKKVRRCITNGIELLDETPWSGQWIPIFPMLGKEKYVGKDGQVERVLESQIRNAIDGQKAFDSAKTNEVEAANMVPKIVYLGYEKQFDTSTDWANINKIPTVYAEVVRRDENGEVMEKPTREAYDPPIQAMEIMAEAARRAIQAAIGSHGFTINDDTNVKSGKAVNSLKAQSDVGNAHFTENAKVTVAHLLRAVNDLLDKIEDTDREVAIRKDDGKHDLVRINAPYQDKTGKTVEHRYTPRDPQTNEPMVDAAHQVLVSTGPSFDQQRDEASEFVDGLMANETIGPRVADLAITWHELGPYGDQMAERVILPEFQKHDGEADIPPQIKQQMGQLQQQNQELVGELQRLLQEREAKTADNESREKIAAGANELKKFQIIASVRIAQIAAASKGALIHEQLTTEENIHLSELEADRQIAELSHQMNLEQAAEGADQNAQQSAQDASQTADQSAQDHQQQLTEQEAGAAQAADASAQGHDQAMVQQDAGAAATLEAQKQAAALTPKPGKK